MRRALEITGLALVGALLGVASLVAVTLHVRAPYEEAYGPWKGSSIPGRVPDGPYDRLAIASRGLVGLPRSETIYLTATTDSEGRPLDPACVYHLRGRPLPARWWSLTPYDVHWELIPNPDGVYSVGSHNLAPGPDGRFDVRLARDAAGPDELPLGEAPGTWIVLRLYEPDAGVADHLASVELPTVAREGCS